MSSAKMLGRVWLPMSSRSANPWVVTRAVRSPRRSSSAFVATYSAQDRCACNETGVRGRTDQVAHQQPQQSRAEERRGSAPRIVACGDVTVAGAHNSGHDQMVLRRAG